MAFCLYVASRVFIHILKKSPQEAEVRSSLEFLLAAMQQFRKVNPLSESFLIQLGLDSEGTGIEYLAQDPAHVPAQKWSSMSPTAKLEVIVSLPYFGLHLSKLVLTRTQRKYESDLGCSPFKEIQKSNKYMPSLYSELRKPDASLASQMATVNDPQAQQIRDTQYSLHKYSLQSFEVSHSLPRSSPNPEFGNFHGPRPQFLSGQEPGNLSPSGSAMDVPNHRTQSERSGEQNSSGPSPENSSSNTSYSPHSQHDDQPTVQMLKKCFSFVNSDGNFLTPPSKQPIDSGSDMPSNLDPAASTATPNISSTGLTPGPDGDWSQMLDSMAWDSIMMNADAPQWNMSPGAMR